MNDDETPEQEPEQHVENDDWHYCAAGCGRRHVDHDEPSACVCGGECPGYATPKGRRIAPHR